MARRSFWASTAAASAVLVVAGVMAAPMASAHHDMVQSPGDQSAPAESGLPAGFGGPVDEPK